MKHDTCSEDVKAIVEDSLLNKKSWQAPILQKIDVRETKEALGVASDGGALQS